MSGSAIDMDIVKHFAGNAQGQWASLIAGERFHDQDGIDVAEVGFHQGMSPFAVGFLVNDGGKG
jgi:hypothetical protein